MYESYFGLTKKPFQITSDPGFLWMGKKHREALSTLKYGVMDNKGFLLLTGDVGTGKTTLINRLVEDLRGRAYTAKIPDPGLSKYDFYRLVARYFNLPIEVKTKADFLGPFDRFLKDAHREKKSVLLVIDEAQRLKHDLMEEIRLLSNLERHDTKLLNIFFVGQNEFNGILLQPENRPLMRRITITYNLDPLNPEETGAYIRHRLMTAGADTDIFSKAAVQAVYDFSGGFPRQINIICDLALFFASQVEKKTISAKIVNQCRERISFCVEEKPPKRGGHRQMSFQPTSHPPTAKECRLLAFFPLLHGLSIAVVVVVLAAGLFFTPDQYKSRARQWVQKRYQNYVSPPSQPVTTTPPTNELSPSATTRVESDSFPVAEHGPGTAMASEVPIRSPLQPPSPPGLSPVDASALTEQTEFRSLSPAGVAKPDSNPPDPAEAIDWLLKKRAQKNS